MFSMQSISQNPLVAKFKLSSTASLSLGWSQNGVLGNGLINTLSTETLLNLAGLQTIFQSVHYLLFFCMKAVIEGSSPIAVTVVLSLYLCFSVFLFVS